jgi:hypothetical protein
MIEDVAPLIWEVLGEDRITTKEAGERLDHIFSYRCPDDLAKTMIKLRNAGLVKGQISMEMGGWIWWADEECRSRRIPKEGEE